MKMTNDARAELERELEEILQKSRDAFAGDYGDKIDALLGLSRKDIDAITPGTTDLEVYDALIEVVKEASRRNMSQAELKLRITQLGSIALKIAEKIPGLLV